MKQVRFAQDLVSMSMGLALISGIALSPVQAQPAVDTAKLADNGSRPPSVAPGKPQDKARDKGADIEILSIQSPRDIASGQAVRNKPPGPNQPPVKR